MTYEAWRCTFQSSEQAARAAYKKVEEQAHYIVLLENTIKLLEKQNAK
jgi:hypothetical protein